MNRPGRRRSVEILFGRRRTGPAKTWCVRGLALRWRAGARVGQASRGCPVGVVLWGLRAARLAPCVRCRTRERPQVTAGGGRLRFARRNDDASRRPSPRRAATSSGGGLVPRAVRRDGSRLPRPLPATPPCGALDERHVFRPRPRPHGRGRPGVRTRNLRRRTPAGRRRPRRCRRSGSGCGARRTRRARLHPWRCRRAS